MWVKYSLPRVRIDHMLDFNWKLLTPLALVMVMATAIMDKTLMALRVPSTSLTYTFWMLMINIGIGWATLSILRTYAHQERARVAELKPVARPEMPAVKPTGTSEV
jgi:NADH-quinone oxidoreductase subunit H